jgi:hypothetical protein
MELYTFFSHKAVNIDFQCKTRVRKFSCAQMVGTILDFAPCNVLNIETNQVQYKAKTQKKITT